MKSVIAVCLDHLEGRRPVRLVVLDPVRTGQGVRPGRFGALGVDSPHHRRLAAAPSEPQRREMILATTKVEDFDRFVKIFSTKGAEKRKQHGSKGSTVFRDPNEDDRVWVLFDWDAEGWQNFVSDPEVPPIMQEAGHKGKPQAAKLGGQYDA
jgi:hypothetical protein